MLNDECQMGQTTGKGRLREVYLVCLVDLVCFVH